MTTHKVNANLRSSLYVGTHAISAEHGDLIKCGNVTYYVCDAEDRIMCDESTGWVPPTIPADNLLHLNAQGKTAYRWESKVCEDRDIWGRAPKGREADYVRGLLHCVDTACTIPGSKLTVEPGQGETLREHLKRCFTLATARVKPKTYLPSGMVASLKFSEYRSVHPVDSRVALKIAELGAELLLEGFQGFDTLRSAMHDVELSTDALSEHQLDYVQGWLALIASRCEARRVLLATQGSA